MNQVNAIKHLNNVFPECNATDASDFYGYESDLIWFKGGTVEGEDVINMGVWVDTFGTLPALERELKSIGWCSEAYDYGTLHAFNEAA